MHENLKTQNANLKTLFAGSPIRPFARSCSLAASAFLLSLIAGCSLAPRTDPALRTGDLAPEFALKDAHASDSAPPINLSDVTRRAPVLVIFYEGYSCPRCVTHLANLDSRLAEFDKAGLQILAISADSPADSRDSITLYGDFHFPLLSDPKNTIARSYGLSDDNPHGAFIIDRSNHIRFAYAGDKPFTDIDQLLQIANSLQAPTASQPK